MSVSCCFFLGPIDTTQRHVVDSVSDTKNHVGDIGVMSPHADHVGVVSFRTNTRHVCDGWQKTTYSSTTHPPRQHARNPMRLRRPWPSGYHGSDRNGTCPTPKHHDDYHDSTCSFPWKHDKHTQYATTLSTNHNTNRTTTHAPLVNNPSYSNTHTTTTLDTTLLVTPRPSYIHHAATQ